jgi:hypothetical protein
MKSNIFRAGQSAFSKFFPVFLAVFLGFLANQWRDSYNNRKRAEQAIENIKVEIEDNTPKLKEMLKDHKQLLVLMDSSVTSVENHSDNENVKFMINFELISSNSWEMAKLTQSVTHMDTKLASAIAGVYEFQAYYKNLMTDLADQLPFRSESAADSRKSMLEMRDKLRMIVSLEANLLEYYKVLEQKIEKGS